MSGETKVENETGAGDSEQKAVITNGKSEETKKEEPSGTEQTETTAMERKIIRQMEFYFGDRNLVKDNFLQEKIKENPDGWVSLDVLLTFNRLKMLTTDQNQIREAVKKSTSGLLEVSDDGASIRRVNTTGDNLPSIKLLSPDVRKEIKGRTLHMKGFPEDASFDDIQDFVLGYGETVLIQMRRYTTDHEKANKFKGSVFVEFKEVSSVAKVLEQQDLKYKDAELFKETKEEYLTRQNLKRKKSKETAAEDEPKAKVAKVDDSSEADLVRQKDAILHFKGCGSDTKREDLKELLNQWSEVAWVDFQMGETKGYVRFDEDGGAKKVLEAMTKDGSTPQICGCDTELRVLEGDEEFKYWKKMNDDQIQRRKKKSGRGGWGRGGGRGGFKRKRSRNNED